MDPSLLDDDEFEWIGPYVDRPLDKTDYLAAGRFFSITTAFPDLNFRAHDFRVDDDEDVATVRMTCRTTGTMRGELRLRDEILPPTGNIMTCPPEAVSMKFNLETGKVVKICSGFCMDRVVGNTDGTTGVIAAAITGGKPISDWEVYPPLTVLQRIFGRPEALIEEAKNFLAPFPETVMIQLSKGILTSNMAVEDPSLLSEDFVFSTPSAGPIGKREFLEKYAPEEFNGVQPKFRNYRVDPYDPNRVWVDVMPKGPGYVGSPQAMSFAFDADGFCTRITSWYILDPTVGNGGGLGGPAGFKFAQGSANEFAARPLPRILGRVKNSFLDLFRSKGEKKVPVPVSLPPPPSAKKPVAAAVPKPSTPVQRLAASKTPALAPASSERERLPIPLQKLTKSFGTINLLEMQRESATQRKQREPVKKKASLSPKTPSSFKDQLAKQREALTAQAKALQAKQKETNATLKRKEEEAARKKQSAQSAQRRKQEQAVAAAEQKRRQQQEAAAAAAQKRKQQQQEPAQKKQAVVEAQKRRQQAAAAAAEQKRKQQQEAAQKKQAAELSKKVAAEQKQRELEEQKQADLEKRQKLVQEKALQEQRLAQQREMQRQKNERIEAEKRKQQERVRLAKQAKKEESALKALSKTPVVSTFRLFGLGGSDEDDDESDTKAAPAQRQPGAKKVPGVPTLSRWRRNLDGSVSGLVSGSRSFTDGERITTSPIESGNLSSGEVVVTGSGSKYFLD